MEKHSARGVFATGAAMRELGEFGYIVERLRQAFEVISRMPFQAGDAPAGFTCSMPDIVRGVWEYGWQSAKAAPPRPTSDEIAAANEAIGWLWWIDGGERAIVSLRCAGISWPAIARRIGKSRPTVIRHHDRAIERIAHRDAAEKRGCR